MSEDRSQTGPESSGAEAVAAGSWSANGAGGADVAVLAAGEATTAEAEAEAEATAEVAAATADSGDVPTMDETSADSDAPRAIVEEETPIAAEAVKSVEDDGVAAASEPAPDAPATLETPPAPMRIGDDRAQFLAELARSMRATAANERARLVAETEQRRRGYIDQIHARQSSEADRMRELAAEELKSIDEWAEVEIARIRTERQRRADELNADLETSLSQHGEKIDAEIGRVEAAISAYRSELGAFFDRLDGETDIVVLAQAAGQHPAFPALEVITAEPVATVAEPVIEPAAASPEPEPPVVGVMDPDPAPEPAQPWAVAPQPAPEPLAASPEPQDAAADAEVRASAEPVPTSSGSSHGSSLFQSVPVLRPMSWLRGDRNEDSDPR
jgi:hypothetical protein